jgi:D-alanine transfer protein
VKRLIAIALSVLLFIGSFVAYDAWLPAQNELDPTLDYRYAYDHLKEKSPQLVETLADQGTTLVFGSSELAPNPLLSQHVVNLSENYGIDLNFITIGSANTQSLQHAIELGALAPNLRTNKVAFIISPQWFTGGGVDQAVYQSKFSWESYRLFMANPNLSEETRKAVAKRVTELGVDQQRAWGIEQDTPLSSANELGYSFVEDIHLRRAKQRALYPTKIETGLVKPDWSALLEAATTEGKKNCVDNDFGIETGYWNTYIADDFVELKGSKVSDRFLPSSELDDLRLFLQVCQESAIEPLLVIVPVNGRWYDYAEHPQADRAALYQAIRDLCNEMDTRYADFSDREYEKYFLSDIMHLGWRGWVQVEQAIAMYSQESGRLGDG